MYALLKGEYIMTQRKKWITPQILFPSAILFIFVIVMTISMSRPTATFTAVKTDEPGNAQASWIDIEEKEFYQKMSVAVRAEFQSDPVYYDVKEPEADFSIPLAVYEIWVGDVLADSRTQEQIEAGKIYRIHSLPSAFTDSEISTESPNHSFILMLSDQRDNLNSKPKAGVSADYYDDYFDMFGYGIITPSCSIIPTEGFQVKTELLPEYLQGGGEYTTMHELQEILAAGREKYGIKEFDTQS